MQVLEEQPKTESARSFSDRLLGSIAAAMLLLAVVAGIGSLIGGEPEAQVPVSFPLKLESPANGAAVGNPVEMVFATEAPLTQTPMGWGTGEMHLHAAVNGQDVMPAGPEITQTGSGRYRWRLRLSDPGEYTLRLFWSGPDHAPIAEGASAPVSVRVAP